MNLILIGFMGVGKTSVGRRLAKRLGWPFVDTDALIEEARSMTVEEIFATWGEDSFRQTERQIVERVSRRRYHVIATGGGVVLDPDNTKRLKECGLLIHLSLPLSTIRGRIGPGTTRPLFRRADGSRELERLFLAREALYNACCDVRIDRSGISEEETVERILDDLRSGPLPLRFIETGLS